MECTAVDLGMKNARENGFDKLLFSMVFVFNQQEQTKRKINKIEKIEQNKDKT